MIQDSGASAAGDMGAQSQSAVSGKQLQHDLDIVALRASEERLRTLADAVPQLIWTNDDHGFANYFNRRWFEYSGLTYEDCAGIGWMAMVHPDDAPASKERWHQSLTTGRMFDTEYRLRASNGAYRWFIGRNVPLRDESGKVKGWFGTATEIEELKRAQEAAHESEARLRVTMESAVDHAIITMDLQGIILAWSTGAERTLGFRAEEAVGQHCEIIFTPEDRAAGVPHGELRKAWESGRAEDERWHVRADGSRLFMSGVVAPIYDVAITGFVKVARDMTDRQHAEEAIRESEARYRDLAEDLSRTKEALLAADRQKDQFIATLAHELRNPLAPVRSAMQLISMSGSQDPAVLWALDVVNRQTNSMARLIDDLMDVSRISQNKLMLRTERVELATVLRDAMDISRSLMVQQDRTLTVNLPSAPVLLDGDGTRLAQVFANLLDNAVKYSQAGGVITLSAAVDGEVVEVRVHDTGIGIATENLESIFALFSQVRTSKDRGKGGLGIGLALVKQLVQLHGGTIAVQSAGTGLGSEFIVRLPLATYAGVAMAEAEEADPHMSFGGVRILVVDDNVDAADVSHALFTRVGSTVRAVYDGSSALVAAEEFLPNIVLMDIGLPKRSGHEVAEYIRASEWGRDMILVAISGWGSEEEKRKSYAAGFDRHLVKPVDPVRLMRVMAELLRERQQRP